MTNEEIVKNLGKQVAKGKILFCPLCLEEAAKFNDKIKQDLSSFGDFENILFCPHCELEIELKVRDRGYNKD